MRLSLLFSGWLLCAGQAVAAPLYKPPSDGWALTLSRFARMAPLKPERLDSLLPSIRGYPLSDFIGRLSAPIAEILERDGVTPETFDAAKFYDALGKAAAELRERRDAAFAGLRSESSLDELRGREEILTELRYSYAAIFTGKELGQLAAAFHTVRRQRQEKEQQLVDAARRTAAALGPEASPEALPAPIPEAPPRVGMATGIPLPTDLSRDANPIPPPVLVPPKPAKDSRALGLLDMLAIGLNSIVGAGIFMFPGKMAALLGPASIVPFAVTGLLLIPVGLCFAEASTYFNRTGGSYLHARTAFGDKVAFGVGWMTFIAQIAGWAAVANGIALYLSFFHPTFAAPLAAKAVAGAVIVFFGALNYGGVKLGALFNKIFIVAKLVPLGLFILAGGALLLFRAAGSAPSPYVPFAPLGWANLGAAMFMSFFAFKGFQNIPTPAGEVKNPSKTLPLALIGSLALVMLLYIAIQAVAVGVHPGIAESARPLADAALNVAGRPGAVLMAAGAVLSGIGFNAGTALITPRYLEALAADEHFPKALAASHPRFGTPHRAVLATVLAVLGLALFLDFNSLVGFANLAVTVQMLATCLSVPFLRRYQTPVPGGFRVPGGPWLVPVLGGLTMLGFGLHATPSVLAWVGSVLAAGFAFRAVSRLFRARP